MKRPILATTLAAATLALGALLAMGGCATRFERRDPTGETFPTVTGTALSGEAVTIPDDFAGEPLLLLAAFDQDAQFDVDRWLLGILDAQLDVAVREVPTIPGFVPGLISGTIDAGMKRGIPSEDWGTVITVYDDGETVAQFTGSVSDNNTRVMLLDGAGRVVWFHDRGYSARELLDLRAALERLR